jgi:hypothetical protein
MSGEDIERRVLTGFAVAQQDRPAAGSGLIARASGNSGCPSPFLPTMVVRVEILSGLRSPASGLSAAVSVAPAWKTQSVFRFAAALQTSAFAESPTQRSLPPAAVVSLTTALPVALQVKRSAVVTPEQPIARAEPVHWMSGAPPEQVPVGV